MSARDDIIARAGAALSHSVTVPEVPRDYNTAGAARLDPLKLVELFSERVGDYGAQVHFAPALAPERIVSAIAQDTGARRLAASPALALTLDGVELFVDEPPLPANELDHLDGALTGSVLAIAETGTIVLDGSPSSGRRIISLIPDAHICLVESSTIVATLPDAIDRLASAARHTRPLTFVSGPSATVDIGFDRVQGVHGPRRLHVVLLQ